MRATSLLQKQHRRVNTFLTRLEGAPPPAEVAKLVAQLATQLAGQLVIEEELFRPALRAMKGQLGVDAGEEPGDTKFMLMSLLATRPDDAAFQEKVTGLKEIVERRARAHEENLFPKVEREMDEEQLQELGQQMKLHFYEVVESGYEAALVRSMTH